MVEWSLPCSASCSISDGLHLGDTDRRSDLLTGVSGPPPAPPVTVNAAAHVTVTLNRYDSPGWLAVERSHVCVQACRGSAVPDHAMPGAQVEVDPSPKLQRADVGRAVTVTVTPPTVVVPVIGCQFGIRNQLAG